MDFGFWALICSIPKNVVLGMIGEGLIRDRDLGLDFWDESSGFRFGVFWAFVVLGFTV